MTEAVKPAIARPDAVLMPMAVATKAASEEAQRLLWYKTQFGPVLQSRRVFARQCHGGKDVLLSPEGADVTLYFPQDHPRAGQDRYRWEPQDGGVQFGYLIEDDAPDAA
jgi:hypothetical protein